MTADAFIYDVAFSFAGEQHAQVEPIAADLQRRGLRVFFHRWPELEGTLPSVSLKANLERLYGTETRLVVQVLSADYERKAWTTGENQVVQQELIRKQRSYSVFLLAADNTLAPGYLPQVDAAFSLDLAPTTLADAIEARVRELKRREIPAPGSRGLDGVPALPDGYVVRTEDLARLQQALTTLDGPLPPLATALVGMGGLGKTTLAQAICQPAHRPARYEDAAWIPVTDKPVDLAGAVRRAAIALGADAQQYALDDAVWPRFAELLRTRSILVVLDDVWDAAHLEPFLVEGARAHILVTTRNDEIRHGLRVKKVEAGSLAAADALQLLRAAAGRADPQDPDIVERLKRHPLALRVAGRQLEDDRSSSADWLASFTGPSQLRSGSDDLIRCFDLSRDRLSAEEQPRFDALGIFRARVPDETVLGLWAQMGLEIVDGRRLLARLDRLALVDRSPQGVALHDLLRDYAGLKLAKPKDAHRALLRAYGASNDADIPAGREDDPYYLRYSMHHFEHAGLKGSGGTVFGQHDWAGWSTVFFWMLSSRKVPIVRPSSTKPDRLPDDARIALMGNWAIGRYGALAIAGTLREQSGFSLIVQLGGVYRAGRPVEVEKYFLKLWPFEATTVSRAVNGGHNMLSGGKGYFQVLLKKLDQASSYFAFATTHWLFIALDTAYIHERLDDLQREWLEATLAQADGRRIVVFSHNYVFSMVEGRVAEKLHASVAPLLARHPVAAWYWSHDMHAVIYDPSTAYGGLRARSAGHGGAPAIRQRHIKELPAEKHVGSVAWRRFPSSEIGPSGLVLDGPNPYMRGDEARHVPHGYVTLTLDGPTITERYHLPDGTEIWKGVI